MPKILAIDDKQDNLITISSLLMHLIPDCNVIMADSGEVGIEKAKAELPDTILLDIRMPGMDGYEVCRRLKADKSTAHIPIVMLTAIELQMKKPEIPKIELPKDAGTVLLVEDEEMVMDVCRALLEKLGCRVLVAMNGKEAVNIAKSYDGTINLAILDIILPDIGGKVVYPLHMEALPDLKVIVCSGYSVDGPAQEILDAGAQGFIQKPFTFTALSEKMKDVLRS